ncbi:DNA-binding domain-containing protein [Pseudomonas sp. 43(2021)]|uniref:conjugal transfer nickase/helicase domain-containing protein n=1 Tax=Pseudomonas sp. 43(2021) TaxID=2813560 RepID=UPI001A9F7769|nr:DNA-binding domain-containing protein [Pseudomonas sp. 43(2021)]
MCSHSDAKLGTTEPWRKVQRHFEKLNLHQKMPNGRNIWACKAQGLRNTSSLNGYLLREAKCLANAPPVDNPFLSLTMSILKNT